MTDPARGRALFPPHPHSSPTNTHNKGEWHPPTNYRKHLAALHLWQATLATLTLKGYL